MAVPPSAEEAELERGRAREMEAVAFKNPQRAADKARTCYGGDVSQLLDICRCDGGRDDKEGTKACQVGIDWDSSLGG